MQFGRGYRQGTERYVRELCNGLRARGHDVLVLAGDPERRGPDVPPGTRIDDDPPALACPTAGWMAVRGVASTTAERVMADISPDVVHLANPAHVGLGPADVCRRLGVPYVITTMDYWWLCPKATLSDRSGRVCDADVTWRDCVRCIVATHPRRAVRMLAPCPPAMVGAMMRGRARMRGAPPDDTRAWFNRRDAIARVLAGAAHVIFPSSAIERRTAPRLGHARSSRIVYGLDDRWWVGETDRDDHLSRVSRDPPCIGFAGALAPHKGTHVLLDAIRQLGWPDVRVEIAGGGDRAYARRLRGMTAGLDVHFVGSIPPERMPAFLRGLDVLVVPSLWLENAPYVVLEAHAVGTPVLASDMDGLADVVPDPQRRFAPGDAASLAEALRRFRQRREPMPLPRVSTLGEMTEQTLAVYAQAIAFARGNGASSARVTPT